MRSFFQLAIGFAAQKLAGYCLKFADMWVKNLFRCNKNFRRKGSGMRRNIYFIILLITTISYIAPAEEPVYFADANLKAVVEETLDIINPTPTDMLSLTSLEAYNKEIIDLTGLEYATNLQTLGLHQNQISDISLLSTLTNLQELYLSENQISEISILSELTSLQHLNLSGNPINDITPLSGLANLKWLGFQGNQIIDISSLSKLTRLTSLTLGCNQISDISSLSDLTNLQLLWLSHNQISDIWPLAGLTNLRTLYLNNNQISDIIPISGLTNLRNLDLTQNQINDFSPLSELKELQELRLLHTQINDISILSGLTSLLKLNLGNNQISDLSPLSGLIGLQELLLGSNQVSDISPLSGLTSLERLGLGYNQISNISALTTLMNLDYLTLWNNPLNHDYCYIYIQQIRENNPGIELYYDECMSPPTIIYVDDNAAGDPGAGNPQISDENEDGSWEHPFDTIQEAIDVAEDGYTVLVYPGIYPEEINFLGKAITVQGMATAAGIPVLENPDDIAVSFYYGERSNSILKNFVIRNSVTAVYIVGSSPTISNITFVDNKYGIINFGQAEPNITNSIFWNNSKDDLFQCQAYYSCIERGGEGEGNINVDPLFADPNNSDYHLRSEQGRYSQEHHVWILDISTSPCIDAGDPSIDPSSESWPNGGRINMGAYGGTAFASMSE